MKTEERKIPFENAQLNGSRNENIRTSCEKVFISTSVSILNYSSLFFNTLASLFLDNTSEIHELKNR